MKLILLKNNLLYGLQALERAVGNAANLPILKDVLFKTSQGKIYCVATNLDLAIQNTISGKIIEDGEGTIPFQVFYTTVKNIPTERISIEVKNDKFGITTDNYEAIIQGHSVRDFPIIPTIHNKSHSLKIRAGDFIEALECVIVATQYSEIRPEISGVFLRYQERQLVLVATDSFRLAEYRFSSSNIHSSFESISVIIPLKTAEEVLRIFENNDEMLEIYIDQNQILFYNEHIELISRLVDGSFPEYQAIIPKQTQHEITFDRQEFLNAVKLTSTFSGRANDIVVRVGENGKFIELFSADGALGENHYKVPIKLKGDVFSITFNWKYLLDGLRVYKGKEVVLGVNAVDRPAVIMSPQERFLIYVVMPIKV